MRTDLMTWTIFVVAVLAILVGWKAQPLYHHIKNERLFARYRARFHLWRRNRNAKPREPLGEVQVVAHTGPWNYPVDWIYAQPKDPTLRNTWEKTLLVAHYPQGGVTDNGAKVGFDGYVIHDGTDAGVMTALQFNKKYTTVPTLIVGRYTPPPPKVTVAGSRTFPEERQLTRKQAAEKEAYLEQLAEEYELKS